MKKLLTFSVILFLCTIVVYGQNTITSKSLEKPWTQSANQDLFDDLMKTLTPYQYLSNSQKETIAICGLEEITKKHNMTSYLAKLEVQVKRIKKAELESCAKSSGVELVAVKDQANSYGILEKTDLAGCWQAYEFSICFREDGKYTKHFDKKFSRKKQGKWFLEADSMIFVTKKGKKKFKIAYHSKGSLKLVDEQTKEESHYTKI